MLLFLGFGALHIAVQKENTDIIDRLVRYNINLDVQVSNSLKASKITLEQYPGTLL